MGKGTVPPPRSPLRQFTYDKCTAVDQDFGEPTTTMRRAIRRPICSLHPSAAPEALSTEIMLIPPFSRRHWHLRRQVEQCAPPHDEDVITPCMRECFGRDCMQGGQSGKVSSLLSTSSPRSKGGARVMESSARASGPGRAGRAPREGREGGVSGVWFGRREGSVCICTVAYRVNKGEGLCTAPHHVPYLAHPRRVCS